MVLSQHEYDEVWKLVVYKDKKIRLAIPEMLSELASLRSHNVNIEEFPFILLSVNAVAITPTKFTVTLLGEK